MSRRGESHERHEKHEVLRFGEVAKRLGFIDDAMLTDALMRQRRRVEQGEHHKLLGLILLEMGHIDNEQLIEILRSYERAEHAPTA